LGQDGQDEQDEQDGQDGQDEQDGQKSGYASTDEELRDYYQQLENDMVSFDD
jgi:hypothetical protein